MKSFKINNASLTLTFLLTFLFAFIVGCSDQSTGIDGSVTTNIAQETTRKQAQTQQTATDRDSDAVVALVGDKQVLQSEIDQSIRLQLFDLEWAKYELRRAALATKIKSEMASSNMHGDAVQVLIEPPMPPRLKMGDVANQPAQGSELAPVILAVFCSYPSSHCARMTQTYDALLRLYQDKIRLVFFDFPQAYHRDAGHAAVAARCADQEGKFWPYHKGLLANFNDLNTDLFMRLATQVNLDSATFKACLESNKVRDAVMTNLSQAERIGLSKVPVTLINGLFINGPKSIDIFRYFIDQELMRLNIEDKDSVVQQAERSRTPLPLSELPLRLQGIVMNSEASMRSATLENAATGESQTYRQDDEIMPAVYMVMIEEAMVVIENSGRLERILLTSDSYAETAVQSSNENEVASQQHGKTQQQQKTRSLVEPEEVPAGLEYTYRGVVDSQGEMPLSRVWLEEALRNQDQLVEHFEATEHEVEGVYMMRVRNVGESEFYQTLGLKEKDVVMRVNDQWIHSSQNGLFETLEAEQEVSLVVMRRGLPVHLKYVIN